MIDEVIRDDNLHLVLSKGHEEWLRCEIRDRIVALAVFFVLFVGAIGWYMSFVIPDDIPPPRTIQVTANTPESTIKGYEAEGYTVSVVKDASSKTPVPSTSRWKSRVKPVLGALFTLTSLVLIIAIPLFAIKASFDIRRLRRWQRNHEAFLAAYNRGETKAPPA